MEDRERPRRPGPPPEDDEEFPDSLEIEDAEFEEIKTSPSSAEKEAKEAKEREMRSYLREMSEALDKATPATETATIEAMRLFVQRVENLPLAAELAEEYKALESQMALFAKNEMSDELYKAQLEARKTIGHKLVELSREPKTAEQRKAEEQAEKEQKRLVDELTHLNTVKNALVQRYDDLVSKEQFEKGVPADPNVFHPATPEGENRLHRILSQLANVTIELNAKSAFLRDTHGIHWPPLPESVVTLLEASGRMPGASERMKSPGMKAYVASMPREEIAKMVGEVVKKHDIQEKLKKNAEKEKKEGPTPEQKKAVIAFGDALTQLMRKGKPNVVDGLVLNHWNRKKFNTALKELHEAFPKNDLNFKEVLAEIIRSALVSSKDKNINVIKGSKDVSVNARRAILDDLADKLMTTDGFRDAIWKLPQALRELEKATTSRDFKKFFRAFRKQAEILRQHVDKKKQSHRE